MLLEPATGREAGRWALGVVRARRGRLATTAAVFLLAAGAALVGPQLLGLLVDEVLRPEDRAGAGPRVDLLALAFLVSLLGAAALRGLAQGRMGTLGEELLAANREQLVERSLSLPLGTVEAVGTGALLSRATTDLERVDFAARYAVPTVATAGVTVLLTLTAMLLTSPLLSLALLVALPTLVLPTRWFLRRVPVLMTRMLERWSVVQSRTHESAVGARTLDGLGLLARRRRADAEHLDLAADGEVGLRDAHVRWAPWLELSAALPLAAVLLLGGVAYANGLVGLGTVATMALYVQLLSDPLAEVLWWSEDLLVAVTALRRVLGVRGERQRRHVADTERPQRAVDHEPGLRLDGLHFGYRADRPVLRGVDLVVPEGQRLAIVGGSGAGKSTLARLVAGVAAPDCGSVRLDGDEVSAIAQDELRRRVLLLTQEHHVFTGTLRDNLLLPAGDFGDDDLWRALRVVGLDDLARRLPGGLDAAVGAGAATIDPPAAQRLALARVVLADPGTVVLDEATSLLDTATARSTERALDGVLGGRTVIAIAHRLHTAAAADRVVVMADGRVVEDGTPRTLAAADGPYARLLAAAGQGLHPPSPGDGASAGTVRHRARP